MHMFTPESPPNARLWSHPVARVVLCWEADALTAHLCYTLSARVRSLGVRRQEYL